MVDLVTYVKRMPVKGETDRSAELRNGPRRQGRQSGGRRRQARRIGGDGHQGRRRHVRRQYDQESRRLRRRHQICVARQRPLQRRRADHGRAVGRKLDPDRQRRQRRSLARRHRARRRGSEDLRPHPAAARNSRRDGLCGDRVRQAPWRQDAAQSGAGRSRSRSRAHSRRDFPRAQRDGTCDPHRACRSAARPRSRRRRAA